MQQSKDRILITHTGSLPRGEKLGNLLMEEERGQAVDKGELGAEIERRVGFVLKKQAEAGGESATDGEPGRGGFQTYIPQRMSGFGGVSKRPGAKEFTEFPLFTSRMMARIPHT
ncbi:MAG: cobalamin-independent methionine synthase II family protein, partial [Steroidobacteraceae bacterium]